MDQERYETSEITDTSSMIDRAKGAVNSVADNPMLMLLGGLAVGFVIGMFVPVSRFENEQLGPVADDLKRRGGEAIKESIEAATESMTASRSGTTEY